jgi:hypothetical protein
MRVDAIVPTHIIVQQATAARTVANFPYSLLASRWKAVETIVHGNKTVVVEFYSTNSLLIIN